MRGVGAYKTRDVMVTPNTHGLRHDVTKSSVVLDVRVRLIHATQQLQNYKCRGTYPCGLFTRRTAPPVAGAMMAALRPAIDHPGPTATSKRSLSDVRAREKRSLHTTQHAAPGPVWCCAVFELMQIFCCSQALTSTCYSRR